MLSCNISCHSLPTQLCGSIFFLFHHQCVNMQNDDLRHKSGQ